MNLLTAVERIDANTARSFVHAARHVIDALLIEATHVRQAQTPAPRDYNEADMSRETPGGGWLSHDELRDTARRLGEAIAAEKWTDGVLCTLQVLRLIGGLG